MNFQWDFRAIPEGIARDYVIKAISEGDLWTAFLHCGDENRVAFLWFNHPLLQEAGVYEEFLIDALTGTHLNLHNVPLIAQHNLLCWADRDKLLSEGDGLPDGESFKLYRGVSGHGPARRLRGISWTSNLEKAKWFATRYGKLVPGLKFAKPGVLVADVPRECVYACYKDRNESEFICIIPKDLKLKYIWKGW